jgi:hypothetical protein
MKQVNRWLAVFDLTSVFLAQLSTPRQKAGEFAQSDKTTGANHRVQK